MLENVYKAMFLWFHQFFSENVVFHKFCPKMWFLSDFAWKCVQGYSLMVFHNFCPKMWFFTTFARKCGFYQVLPKNVNKAYGFSQVLPENVVFTKFCLKMWFLSNFSWKCVQGYSLIFSSNFASKCVCFFTCFARKCGF